MQIFNINPNYNFLESLAWWISKEFSGENDGEVDEVMLVLPSKRSCAEFKSIFEKSFPGQNLPKIAAISDISYSQLQFINKNIVFDENFKKIFAKESSDLKYSFELSKKIKNTAFFQNVNTTQSLDIASSLKNLFDDLSKSDISIDDLTIDDFNMSKHRQFAIDIIKDFYCDFKNYSSKSDILSSIDIQKLKIKYCTDLLEEYGLQKKVIIAGSTGSVNYMKDFMRVIHSGQNGYIVTTGFYDRKSDELSEKDPAFLLHDLLDFLKIDENDVQNIANLDAKISPDERFDLLANHVFSNDFSSTEIAAEKKQAILQDFSENFKIFKAKNEIEEAKSIVEHLISQNQVNKDQKIAIICPNMNLMVLIKRFLTKSGLKFNDYEKTSLLDLEFAKLFLLIAKSIDENMNSVSILAILKSNLVANCKITSLIHEFERKFIRSYQSSHDISDLLKSLEEENLCENFSEIANILTNIHEIYQNIPRSSVFTIFSKITEVILKISDKSLTDFFTQDQLEKFNQLGQALENNSEINISKNESYDFFAKIFSFANFSRDFLENCNIEISNTIESRLINYDLLFFTGLNKANYPALEKDSWLSGKIRKELGVFNNDKKISLASYDFCNLLSNKKVILSFSSFINGSKAGKSQFLMKLETVLKKNRISLLNLRDNNEGEDCLGDSKNGEESFAQKSPEIKTSDYLKSFAASDIEVISSNPYSFYAKKILKLKKEQEIDFAPGPSEFGTFMHKLIEQISLISSPKIEDLNVKINKLFHSFYKCKESKLIWLPKAQKIVENFVNDNEQFLRVKAKNYLERSVTAKFSDFTINAKIDRIHVDDFDEISIIDYKTGTIPSIKDVRMHKKPQLLIYTLIIQQNDKELRKFGNAKSIQYWKLTSAKDVGPKKILADEKLDQSIVEIEENLAKLMNFLANNEVSFRSISSEKFRDDYFHLSRINKS